MTPAQCRAARALLGMHQATLAKQAGIAASTLIDFEAGSRTPRGATISALKRALENAGAIFLAENGEGAGVRLKKGAANAEL